MIRVEMIRPSFTCPECDRVFDVIEDIDEIMFGHDCEEIES